MSTKNNGMLQISLTCAIVAVVLLVIILVAPFVQNETFWVCCLFMAIAVVTTFIANYYVVSSSRSTTSALYRVSLTTVSIVYLVCSSVVNLLIMALATVPLWITLIVEIVMLALCLLGFIGGSVASKTIEQDEDATATSIASINNMRMQIQTDIPLAKTPVARRAIERLAEALQYADPVSSPATFQLEQQLATQISFIESSLVSGNDDEVIRTCDQAVIVIQQRAAVARAAK